MSNARLRSKSPSTTENRSRSKSPASSRSVTPTSRARSRSVGRSEGLPLVSVLILEMRKSASALPSNRDDGRKSILKNQTSKPKYGETSTPTRSKVVTSFTIHNYFRLLKEEDFNWRRKNSIHQVEKYEQ